MLANFNKYSANGVVLEAPHFASSVCKSTNNFGVSFVYDAPQIWNDLPNHVCSANSVSRLKKKKTYLFLKRTHASFSFSRSFSMALTPVSGYIIMERISAFLYECTWNLH